MNCDQHSNLCTTISHIMMPHHANPAGNVHGGVIMKFIDDAAFVIATRHARCNTVTASIERIDFHRPVHVGDLLHLRGALNLTVKTSMEIGVRVEAENLKTGKIRHIASAYLSFVALDENHKPTPVANYIPTTAEATRRHKEALDRREHRMSQPESND